MDCAHPPTHNFKKSVKLFWKPCAQYFPYPFSSCTALQPSALCSTGCHSIPALLFGTLPPFRVTVNSFENVLFFNAKCCHQLKEIQCGILWIKSTSDSRQTFHIAWKRKKNTPNSSHASKKQKIIFSKCRLQVPGAPPRKKVKHFSGTYGSGIKYIKRKRNDSSTWTTVYILCGFQCGRGCFQKYVFWDHAFAKKYL